jgi:hypothetical protein
LPLIDVDTNTVSPHTMGLERPRPGIGVFQRTFSPVAAFQVAGSDAPSTTPAAAMPRNCGQSTPPRGEEVRPPCCAAADDTKTSASRRGVNRMR